MKKFPLLTVSILLIHVSCVAQGDSIKNTSGIGGVFNLSPETEARLDYAVQHYVDENKLAGGVSLVAHKGKIIYHKAFGYQSLEENQPMQLNSIFRIASMAKPITTVAVLMLVEEGKIRLEDPVEKYLPQFKTIRVLQEDGVWADLKTPVTLRHLLSHTSGTRGRGDVYFRQKKVDFSKAASLQEYVDLLLTAPLKHQPGEGFNYAMNNDMAARIVEIVTQKNFGDFLRERILDPLGMKSTGYIVPEADLPRMTSIYLWEDNQLKLAEGKVAVQSAFPRGNGNMVSTAEDYFRFAQMLADGGVFNGQRLIKKETLDLMTQNCLPAGVPLKVGNTTFPNTGFGLSVAIAQDPETWKPKPLLFENFAHLPRVSYTWPGVTNTYWWVDPENEIVGVVLTQLANPGAIPNFQELTQNFYTDFLGANQANPLKITEEDRAKSLGFLQQSLEKLKTLTAPLTPEQLQYKPAPDRWSIQNNIEHLIKAEEIMWNLIRTALNTPGEGQKSDITDEELMRRASTREQNFKAPEKLLPDELQYANFAEALSSLEIKRTRTIEYVKTTQENLRGHFSRNPVFGNLDAYQWTLHISAHCFRHIEQIEEILAASSFPGR